MSGSRWTRRFGRLRRRAAALTGADGSAIRRALQHVAPGAAPRVLLASPGDGNIGDQAMLEAFLASSPDETVVVVRNVSDYAIPADLTGRARVVALPFLLYGDDRRAHRRDVAALAALLDGAASLSIVGADIMDGVYSLRSSLRRSVIAAAAASAGVPTAVLGFSWSPSAPRAATTALGRAGAAGVRLLVRDPASASRLRALGVVGIVDTTDIVFTDDRRDDAAAAAILDTVQGPFALINASGLVARSVDQVPEYRRLIDGLRDEGLAIVMLPHVLRSSADDRAACRDVADAARVDLLIARQLPPATVRALAARAAVVVTGRMHLAIMALSQGTPAITIATQGKVEGLMGLLEWPALCVDPATGMGDRLLAVARDALNDVDSRARLRRALGGVRALAARNTTVGSGHPGA